MDLIVFSLRIIIGILIIAYLGMLFYDWYLTIKKWAMK